MFSAAAVLANIEGRLPDAVEYSVRFGKPVLLPARAGLYVDATGDGWELALRNLSKGYPHLTATLRPLRPVSPLRTEARIDVLGLVEPLVEPAFSHQ